MKKAGMREIHGKYRKDQERLQLIQQFDERATGSFIREFTRHFRWFLIGSGENPTQAARDYAHQVVVILHFKQDVILTSSLKTFATTIALNLLNSDNRRKRNHSTILKPSNFFDTFEQEESIYRYLEESDTRRLINGCLEMLSDKCRKILRLFMNDVPPQEATIRMGFSSKKIYQVRKFECLDRLEEKLRQCNEFGSLFINS